MALWTSKQLQDTPTLPLRFVYSSQRPSMAWTTQKHKSPYGWMWLKLLVITSVLFSFRKLKARQFLMSPRQDRGGLSHMYLSSGSATMISEVLSLKRLWLWDNCLCYLHFLVSVQNLPYSGVGTKLQIQCQSVICLSHAFPVFQIIQFSSSMTQKLLKPLWTRLKWWSSASLRSEKQISHWKNEEK